MKTSSSSSYWLFPFVVVVLASLQGLNGQSRAPRILVQEIETNDRFLMASVDCDGKLTDSDRNVVQTGVFRPGGLDFFLSGVNNENENALICGSYVSGQSVIGVVEHWKRTAPGIYQMQGQQTVVQPSQYDFVGVAFNHISGKIYLLDCVSKIIYENSWDGASQIPALNWSAWATPGLVTQLNKADIYNLAIDFESTPNKVVMYLEDSGMLPGPCMKMYWDAQTGFHVERLSAVSVGVPSANCSVELDSVSEGNYSLRVCGLPSIEVEVVDLYDDNVIGTGTISANGQVSINLSRVLTIGNKYLVREFGVALDPGFYGFSCPVRYGFSEPMSTGVTFGAMHCPVGYYPGSSSAMSFVSSFKGALLEEREPVLGYMAIAFRDQYGQDPVVQVGNNWLLNTIYFINVNGYVCAPSGLLSGYLQIPNDPALIDAVLLTQFWIQDGETYRLSQIIGAKIEGQEELLRAPSGGSSRTSSLPLDQKFNVKTGGDAIVAQILKQRAQ